MAAAPVTPTSTTEAGYTAAISGSTFLLKTQFTVPSHTCNGQAGIQPGAYLMTTSSTGGGILVGCSAETPGYEAVAMINGVRTVLTKITVAPGDVINISVSVSASTTTVAVIDTTKATRQSETGAGIAPTHLFVGDQAVPASGGGLLAVPNIGKLRFRTTTLNKVDFGSTNPTAVNMANSANVVQITTGKLSATGAAFVTTWVHS
jgi:hypothetical protein